MFSENISILSVFISSLFACKSCHLLHCSLGSPEESFQLTSSVVLSYPVWSSPVEYIHIQCSTVFISFTSRGIAVRCRSVQRGAVTVLYGTFQLNLGQCSVVQSGEVKLQNKTVQPSEMQSRPVQSSELLSGSVQSSPVQSSPVHSVKSAPVRSNSNSFPFS